MNTSAGLFKRTTLTISLSLTLLTCLACSANQDNHVNVDSEQDVVERDKATVLKKMSPKEQISFSKQDLASRLNLEIDAIKVSGATSVKWRSGALGCPKPGMSYTDVLVPGVWIILRVGNDIYRYHSALGKQPFYCPNERAESPAVGPSDD